MARPDYPPVRAPEFPDGMEWLNTPQPLRLADLRGKFVLLDFWTFCCINCMHILPDLKKLEHKYEEELVVIGVHSAKFTNEREGGNIRNAILRYQIEHPVVNDRDFVVWRQYAARAWPTLFLIDPKGYIVGKMAGEGVYEPFDRALQQLIPVFESEGVLNRASLAALQARVPPPARMLAFPGKVSVDASAKRLFITDTNHHRVLITDGQGRVLGQIGSGRAGFRDGPLAEAALRQPQGTCYDPDASLLYVADTENHALRRIDLAAGSVETLAGDGSQAPWGMARATGRGAPLNSPWDVLLHDGRLYVAMAGPHQLWTFDPRTGHGEVYAGSGHENLVDGPRLEAQLAQPSGLASDGHFLYFVDSETSSLRRVPFGDTTVSVETLVGKGLFEFGDVDGRYPSARLQHPLGLAYADGVLYVADSYNHKIKRYALAQRTITTFVGNGKPGYRDGGPSAGQFDEPGGLAVGEGRLFVADTNNHQIRTVDLASGQTATVPVAAAPDEAVSAAPRTTAPGTVAPGEGRLTVAISLPPGYKPNELNPGRLTVSASDARVAGVAPAEREVAYPSTFAVAFQPGETELILDGQVYYCHEATGQCLLHFVALRIPVAVRAGASDTSLTIRLDVEPMPGY